MRKAVVLKSKDTFIAEFERCCREYRHLNIAVAWCGSPAKTLPHMLLENFKGSVKVIVGVAFNHTHPDVFQWLTDDVGADLRVFRDDGDVFHPKIYLFRDKERYALFIGSSNLTYSGFYTNYETNCLIEGTKDAKDIVALESTIAIWRSPTLSFKPSTKWIDGYRNRYKNIWFLAVSSG